ncbi:MAG: hypothetical protein QM638_01970 [Nocardioides sp.]|uniref:hypothetical protein n=1 Tax=Nocardioides sp. TaxID=35761 RepID=UPI0039E38481
MSQRPLAPSTGHRWRTPVWLASACLVTAGLVYAPAATAADGDTLTITADGYELDQTTEVSSLVIDDGGFITVPDGERLTITVDGVETAQAYTSASQLEPVLVPGTYQGEVELVLTDANDLTWQGVAYPFRQALYVGENGIDESKSVTSNIVGGSYDANSADRVRLTSTGEGYNGILVTDGDYAVNDSDFDFTGNGRYDFIGMGAALRASGDDTRLTVDHAHIDNHGAVRTGIVATDGSNLVVKDSDIATHDGTLPDDYVFSGTDMRQAPWLLGIVGNVRATNMLGANTHATYINSKVSSTGWGVLSTDSTSNSQLTAIDTTATTRDEGYGFYADGQNNVAVKSYGSTIRTNDYIGISTGGDYYFGDSGRATVKSLNKDLDLGLTKREIAKIKAKSNTLRSDRFGFMWHGGSNANINAGTTTIAGGTKLRTGETSFLDKGDHVVLNLDGAHGATVRSGTGVLFQLMEADTQGFKGPQTYSDPTGDPTKDDSFDITAVHDGDTGDAIANVSHMNLKGDFYNGLFDTAKNLVVNLDRSSLAGVVSASRTKHRVDAVTEDTYQEVGEVDNTVTTPVNNGVVVSLAHRSTWTVTGESHLTSLTMAKGSHIVGRSGRSVTMTVDGVETPIAAGQTYTGDIVLTPTSGN